MLRFSAAALGQPSVWHCNMVINRKTIYSIVLLVAFFAEAATAFHGKDLVCEKCHVMHYSEDGAPTQPGGEPSEHLLIKEHSTELCLTCHDGKAGVPDVIGEDDINGLTERAAGFFISVDVENAYGHNLHAGEIGTSDLCSTCHSGGSFSMAKIGCIDCHDPHGRNVNDSLNYSYRNLQWASSPADGPVFKAFVKPNTTGLEVYEQENIGYPAPGTRISNWREVTGICLDCHHVFKNDGYTRNSKGICVRHPSTDSERGVWEAINKHGPPQVDLEHWRNGTGTGFTMARVPFIVQGATYYAEATTIATQTGKITNEVFCLTCHKAHGSAYKSSLRWSQDSSLGCQQCHNKG